MDGGTVAIVSIGSTLGVGVLGKMIWSFFTKDTKSIDLIFTKLDKMDNHLGAEFKSINKKLEDQATEFTRKFHELDNRLVVKYTPKEDFKHLTEKYDKIITHACTKADIVVIQSNHTELRDIVRDNKKDIELQQSQLEELAHRVNSGYQERRG